MILMIFVFLICVSSCKYFQANPCPGPLPLAYADVRMRGRKKNIGANCGNASAIDVNDSQKRPFFRADHGLSRR
jgi:hypothetical protein